MALLIVLVEYRCAKSNKKFYKSSNSKFWNKIYKWRHLIAFILIPIMLLGYPIFVDSKYYHIYGFSLIAAAFDSDGSDFVNEFTTITALTKYSKF